MAWCEGNLDALAERRISAYVACRHGRQRDELETTWRRLKKVSVPARGGNSAVSARRAECPIGSVAIAAWHVISSDTPDLDNLFNVNRNFPDRL